MLQTYIMMAESRNPYETLALEEALLDTLPSETAVLYLYRHQNSIIIGRNQNVWAECSCSDVSRDGVQIARRISGGGAVYHDENNLNFSFIVPRDMYDLRRQSSVVLGAVRSLGVDAQFTGRNDLTANSRKFSGNAFCLRKNAAFHHGTILIDTDVARMQRYLQVDPGKMQAKGVASVRSRVVNLRELIPGIDSDMVSKALVQSFAEVYGAPEPLRLRQATEELAASLVQRNADWDWVYGKTPRFELAFEERFAWGGVQVLLHLRSGIVDDAEVFSDAMDASFIDQLPEAFRGCRFDAQCLAAAVPQLVSSASEQIAANDICALLERHVPRASDSASSVSTRQRAPR